jgi:hypothetical protein
MLDSSVVIYRDRAEALRKLADQTLDDERRRLIMQIADHYEQLARSEERICELVSPLRDGPAVLAGQSSPEFDCVEMERTAR